MRFGRGLAELGLGLVLSAIGLGIVVVPIDRDGPPIGTEVPSAPPPPPSSTPPIASYTLQARLDAPTRTITATGRIDWVNRSRVPTSELYFHLYLNGFENTETLLYRSPFVRARGGLSANRFGHTRLKKL